MSSKKKLTLEESFEKLEELIGTLEEPDVSLAASFGAYKEGMELVRACNDQIDRIEKEVRILAGEDDDDEL